MLVRDQDILDLLNSIPLDQMEVIAARFDAIASIIGTEDRDIRPIGSASEARGADVAGGEGKPGAMSPTGPSGTAIHRRTLAKIRAIEKIGRESRARRFREIVSAIKQGLEAGDRWSARYTARAVVAEAFANTPAYFRALDEFCSAIRVLKERSDGEVE